VTAKLLNPIDVHVGMRIRARRVGKGALGAVPTIFESNVFVLIGGHAAGRVRVRQLCPPYELRPMRRT
jgi:hypothetical protein